MANFLGYFFKATKTNVAFPNQYIAFDSYDCTPNQREEIKAYRDENTRELFRITASGMKTKITFSTRGNLHKSDKIAILKFFRDAELAEIDSITATTQRMVQLTYWNEEDDMYKTSYFYRPNMTFKIISTERTNIKDTIGNYIYDIIYGPLNFELIEY